MVHATLGIRSPASKLLRALDSQGRMDPNGIMKAMRERNLNLEYPNTTVARHNKPTLTSGHEAGFA